MSDFAPQFGMTDYGEEGVGVDRDVVARECLIFTKSREAVGKDELHAFRWEGSLEDVGNVIKGKDELVGRKASHRLASWEEGIYIAKRRASGWPKYQSLVTLLPRGAKEFPVPALESPERGT
jgi:hypothetical protein